MTSFCYITRRHDVILWRHVTSCRHSVVTSHDVMTSFCDVTWRHDVTSLARIFPSLVRMSIHKLHPTNPLIILHDYSGLWCNVMMSHDDKCHRMMSWCQMTSHNDVMASSNIRAKWLWNIHGRCLNAGAYSFSLEIFHFGVMKKEVIFYAMN